jgi:hypothetical protein
LSSQTTIATAVYRPLCRPSAVVPAEKRSTAFGIFDTGFGVVWFAVSAIMELLYGKSIPALVLFSVVVQLLALPLLAFANREKASE